VTGSFVCQAHCLAAERMMENEHVLSGLLRKRAEMAGEHRQPRPRNHLILEANSR
jgi:hypothetical protein